MIIVKTVTCILSYLHVGVEELE